MRAARCPSLKTKDTPTIFVAGAADNIGLQSGGWTIEWQGGSGETTEGTTILEAIEQTVSADTQVFYKQAGNFEDSAPQTAEVGIVVLAERPYAEFRGDDPDLTLSDSDLELIQRVKARSEKLIVILLSGRPLIIDQELALADAFVAAWLPGTEGQGVADVLFGDFPFTGKLPFTWPRSVDQLPIDREALPSEGCDAPLFPFGYGLDVADIEPLSLPECP
jgi:beta-glucosidase